MDVVTVARVMAEIENGTQKQASRFKTQAGFSETWDALAAQIAEAKAKGWAIDYPAEMPDLT